MAEAIALDEETHRSTECGLNFLADTVKVTLGPKSRDVVPDKKWGALTITNDDVSIVREIDLEEPYEHIGAEPVKEIAKKTDDIAGDDTITATVLAQTLMYEDPRNVTAGSSPIALKKGIDGVVAYISEQLPADAKEMETEEEIASIAAISADDREVGQVIAETMSKADKEGIITVEESNIFDLRLGLAGGMSFDKGFFLPYFVTNPECQGAILEKPYVLLVDPKVSNIKEPPLVLEKVMQMDKPLFIIAEDVEGEPLATLVVNKIRGTFRSAAIKAPDFDDRRKEMLQDTVILTNGQVIFETVGLKLEDANTGMLGRVRKIVLTKDQTTIVDGTGTPEQIEGRAAQIKAQIENSILEYSTEKLQERLAKLAGGVVVIKVGATTEVELKEHKHRIESAVCSTKTTVEEGIVADGGIVLIQSAEEAYKGFEPEGGKAANVQIIRIAIKAPLKQVAENAGLEGGAVAGEVRNLSRGSGLNAVTGEYGSLLSDGAMDPMKVTRSVLQNMVPIAGLSLTTEAVVADLPEKSAASDVGAGMGGVSGVY